MPRPAVGATRKRRGAFEAWRTAAAVGKVRARARAAERCASVRPCCAGGWPPCVAVGCESPAPAPAPEGGRRLRLTRADVDPSRAARALPCPLQATRASYETKALARAVLSLDDELVALRKSASEAQHAVAEGKRVRAAVEGGVAEMRALRAAAECDAKKLAVVSTAQDVEHALLMTALNAARAGQKGLEEREKSLEEGLKVAEARAERAERKVALLGGAGRAGERQGAVAELTRRRQKVAEAEGNSRAVLAARVNAFEDGTAAANSDDEPTDAMRRRAKFMGRLR